MNKAFRKIWKKFWTPILHNPIIQWTLALILAGLLWLIFLTSKHKFTNTETLKNYRTKPVVFVFFHGRCAMLSPTIKRAKVKGCCVSSRHKDGRMMARLQRFFGLHAIYGSTSDGAVAVMREGVRVIRDKKLSMCVSVDGPSGPSLHLQDGALYFARMSGAPIVPCCFSCSRPIYLDRWDKFMIPKLFGTISVNIGDPIYIDSSLRGTAFETKRQEIEAIMIKQLRDMDSQFNLPEIPKGLNATDYKKQKRNKR
ncbi:MAG: DUF374 domain-containing protein [Alphaproteobacteria bacterium]|nr:DUF374 domain-containing protein [Alphaproteobacteria bacterium]